MVNKQIPNEIDRQIILMHKTHTVSEIGDKLSKIVALEDPQIRTRIQRLIKNGLIKREDLVRGTKKKRRYSSSGQTTGGVRERGIRESPQPKVRFSGSGGRIRTRRIP